jgi:UDP-hydrolysing UDP-N-acetyl-D-glucosamine 2-epimerase
MGEPDWRIFTIGNMALDRFVAHAPESCADLLNRLGLPADFAPFALLIFHPVTEEREVAGRYFENILLALRSRGLRALVGAPNSDPGSRALIQVAEHYAGDPGFHFFRNLDRNAFVSAYKHCRLIIGNSSAGILESASVPVAAVNVGLRQRGRFANANVLFCGTDREEIERAIDQALSPAFKDQTARVFNAYGDGDSSRRALEVIKSREFRPWLHKNEDALIGSETIHERK